MQYISMSKANLYLNFKILQIGHVMHVGGHSNLSVKAPLSWICGFDLSLETASQDDTDR